MFSFHVGEGAISGTLNVASGQDSRKAIIVIKIGASPPCRHPTETTLTGSDSLHFYHRLPVLPSFAQVTAEHLHVDVPGDWWIAVADVAGSTRAIEAGDYKKVNTVGVACIAAVANVDRNVELPFVFGGDGATFGIPGALRERAMTSLRGAQRLARESFGLDLRVGLAPVANLAEQGYRVRLARLRLSTHMTLPVLSGGGWEEAERRVKRPDAAGVLRVQEDGGPAEADFEGFECCWQGVPSFRDHKLALLVAATAPHGDVYRGVFEQIRRIYGEVAEYHPLRAEHLQLAFDPRLLSYEWRVRTQGAGVWRRLGYFVRMLAENLAGRVLFSRAVDTARMPWSRYRADLVENSDFRKFDGMLRMVMDGSNGQTEQLRVYLEGQYRAGRLAYGMHKSREALVTCLVRSYDGNHLHFIDGSDGGYALAARDLKRRLAEMGSGP